MTTPGVVGPLVEQPLASVAGESLDARQPGMDFSINGLYFKAASTDQNPYQRATAQFRKDQLDTSQSYGDQSLVGYWTRGQFSFHVGEGIIYYDADDTVANRYAAGSGMDVTVPGKATPYQVASVTYDGYASISQVCWSRDHLAILDGGAVSIGATATTITDAVSVTTDGTLFYVASRDKIYSVTSAGVVTQQYTLTPGDLAFVTWAKSRLFAITDSGDVYQVTGKAATPPQALGSSDLVCSLSTPLGAPWSACETPGGLYIGGGSNIYVFNVDSSGTLPTLTAGVVAAQLPPGEWVRSLSYNLGNLLISTLRGVRVAEIVNNFGSDRLAFGPLLFLKDAHGSSAYGSGALVVADGDLWFVDFSQQIGQGLQFAYHRVLTDGGYVATAAQGGAFMAVTAAEVREVADGTSFPGTGWLQTGLIRFDTIEAKKFQTVRVRCSGTGGTVRVSKVSNSGAVTSLYTMDASQQNDVLLGLSENDPVESLALRFDVAPDADNNVPTLLGYQVKALPCPERQRMIRVPLMCFDHEIRPSAPRTGHAGAAWEKLNALENMEKSGGVFKFTDWRTGETGDCFIESVEMSVTTSPGAESRGWGGYLFLTIRKL